MHKHLNTLYVSTQGSYLHLDGEALQVMVKKKTQLRVPLHMLESIVCFGNVILSPFLLGRCAEYNIGVCFLTERGRFLASVRGPISGNVLLRREQYRRADNADASTELARGFIAAKVANSKRVLQRALRDHGDSSDTGSIEIAIKDLNRNLSMLQRSSAVDSIRGIEGDSARCYFGVFNSLITRQTEAFVFNGRSRRPPLDAVNALLSFVYTLLLHDIQSALEAVGLDPQVGYLHRDRPGRPSLALDLMEEFRAVAADRLVLSLINRQQVKPSGFELRETGGVYMDEATRKTVLVAYQERKQEALRHPFLDEKVTNGALFHVQALLLARHLRGDIDAYPAFIWK